MSKNNKNKTHQPKQEIEKKEIKENSLKTKYPDAEMKENKENITKSVSFWDNYKWNACLAAVCVMAIVGGMLWWAPWNAGVVSAEPSIEADSTSVESNMSEVIENKNGAGIYFKYLKGIDKTAKQFIILKDSIHFNAAEGELFELSTTKDEINDRPQLCLGGYTLHPEFSISPKDSSSIYVQGHEPIIPTQLILLGDTLMVTFDSKVNVGEVVVYPKFSSTPIDTIKDFHSVTSIIVDTAKINCDTLRIAAKDHISALVKTIICNGDSEIAAVVDENGNGPVDGTSNIWAILLTFAGVLGLIVDAIWIYRSYKSLQENKAKSETETGTYSYKDDEILRIEDDIESIKTKIETKKKEIDNLQREIAELKQLMPNEEVSKKTSDIEKEGLSSENTETHDHKPETYEEMIKWYKNEIYEKKWYQDDKDLSSLIRTLDDYLIKEEDSFKGYLKANFEKLHTAWKKNNVSSVTEVTTTYKISSTSIDTPENTEDVSVEQELLEKEEKLKVEKENLNSLETELSKLEKKLSKLQGTSDNKQEETIQDLRSQIKELTKNKEELEQYKNSSEKKIKDAQNEANQKVKDTEEKAQRKINEANSRADKAEKKTETIEEEVTKKFKGEIERKEKTIKEQKDTISGLESDLNKTKSDLNKTQSDLKFANEAIEAKEKALDRFNKTITDIAPARSYAENLEALLKIASNIEKNAVQLGQNPNIDDYLINKYVARYRASISCIDMMMLTTDVLNTTKAQFVYKTQMLAKFDQKDKSAFHESMKMYFFDTYLKKYVDALVVLNETMIGMQYLVDGVSIKDVSIFETYRKEISDILGKLEIEVINVKIMESCKDNLMLTVIPKSLDFECEKDCICQMDNCIVYLKGGNKPNEKIKVIVQK